MTQAIVLVAATDAVLLAAIGFIYRKGVRFRSVSVNRIRWMSIAITAFCLVFSLTAPDVILAMLLAGTAGCVMFLAGCQGAWLSDMALSLAQRRRAERPDLDEAMKRNWVLQAIQRLDQRQRKTIALVLILLPASIATLLISRFSVASIVVVSVGLAGALGWVVALIHREGRKAQPR